MAAPINLKRWWLAPVLFGVGLGVAATLMRSAGGDRPPTTAERVEISLTPDTTTIDGPEPAVVPDATAFGLDPAFLDAITADDTVTAAELERAYDGYLGCLAANGGEGFYTYDVELRTGLLVEWAAIDSTGRLVADVAPIEAACSASFLGDLQARFDATTPIADDLGARQRAAIVDCIRPISADAAEAFPAEITVDTAVDLPTLDEIQLSIDAYQLDPMALGPVSRCISAAGAPWQSFGD